MTTTELKLHEPYTDIRAELATLAEQNDKVVFDYEDPKGNKLARSHIYKFRQIKSDIERRRKELKADVLERGRMIDGVAKELVAQVEDMIAVHEEPIKRIESRETERVAAIQEAIDKIGESSETPTALNPPSSEIARAIAQVEAIDIDADIYQERMAEAVKRKDEILEHLQGCLTAAEKREAEAAELERLRREAAAREQAEREERIRAEAEAKAKREAEEAAAKAKADAERRERELKEQAERAQLEAAEAAQRVEREKVEAAKRAEAERQAAIEQAERDKQQAIEDERRRQREAEEAREREAAEARAEEEKRAANKRHRAKVMSEALIGLAEFHSGNQEEARAIIRAIADGKIPHVTIQF